MAGSEWISTMDENHKQYGFPSYWGVNAEREFPTYNFYSESYNLGWQNHFNYWDQEKQLRYQPPPSPVQAAPQTPNSGMSLEDIVKSLALTTLQFQQDTMAGLQLLGNQISQLATSISKLEAQASQQTEVNPENASAMTPQSREELHMIEQSTGGHLRGREDLEYTEVQNEKVESNLISPPSSNTYALLFPCSMPKSEEDEKEITLNKDKKSSHETIFKVKGHQSKPFLGGVITPKKDIFQQHHHPPQLSPTVAATQPTPSSCCCCFHCGSHLISPSILSAPLSNATPSSSNHAPPSPTAILRSSSRFDTTSCFRDVLYILYFLFPCYL
ncbi:hypothetical protein Sango_1733800 [Sesamum angolense]|uniref:Uncharacterized protein n=1 Tax=Sesamum angolense TaxID=2727404 RepID=A0AAE2BSD7_9LAMI|nr:hypothetical protein Sango_1733800 [Sesamum angolense]